MLWGFLHPLLWIQSPGLEYLCPRISTSCLLSLPCSASKLLMTWLSEPAVQVLGASVLLGPFWFLFLVVSHCSVTSNSVQFSSVAQSCLTLCYPMNQWTSGCQASLSITNCQSQHKPMSTESVMPSNHLILCCPFSSCSIFPSIRVFSNESTLCIRWPKYWSFSFSISPTNEYSGLISFRMDWLDFLAVQGTLKSLLQHHSSKASILQSSAFFTVQLSHPYMTTGKTIALTRQTFVDKVMSLLSMCYAGWS